ncbi:MAG TPA: glycosyltransferase, partial [Solirubrobacteraceae bacterium]|nr:glycosyltransferase [Solirubrobacteraceae bacterium]
HADPEPIVDVVIVSADMADMTLACVAELQDPWVAQIIVVDNAFDEQAGSTREQLAQATTVVALDTPHGFAAANNRGLAVGRAPYALLLNSDILVTPGAIGTLLATLTADPQTVAVGGRLVDPDTRATQPEYRPRPFPTLANLLVIMLGIEELWPGNPVTRRYHGAHVDDERVQAVDQPAAAALLVTRQALDAIGGLDERFWFWFEDSDLLLRLSARGRILYVPQAVFRHLGGGTFRRWSKSERIRSIYHGMLHYGDAHFSRIERLVLGTAALAVSVPRIVLFGRSRPDEASAWRAVAAGGVALLRGRKAPAIAP